MTSTLPAALRSSFSASRASINGDTSTATTRSQTSATASANWPVPVPISTTEHSGSGRRSAGAGGSPRTPAHPSWRHSAACAAHRSARGRHTLARRATSNPGQPPGGGPSTDAQAGDGAPNASVTRHAGTPIAAARRMIAASSCSGMAAGAGIGFVGRGRSAVDTLDLDSRPIEPTRFDLRAGQRGAAAQRVRLRKTEPRGAAGLTAHGKRGLAVSGSIRSVGGGRSLARHDGPLSVWKAASKCPQLVPALRPQQADDA